MTTRMTASTSRSAAWVTASRVVTQIAGLVLLIVAGRVLGPALVGSFILVASIAELFRLAAAAGWYEYVLRERDIRSAANLAIQCTVAAGLILTLVGMGVSFIIRVSPYGSLYANLLIILSLLILMVGPIMVMQAVLVREERIGTFARIAILGEVMGLAGGVGGLMAGAGLYSLAISRTAGVLTLFIGYWAVTRLKVRPIKRGDGLPSALRFSWDIFLSRLISYANNYGSNFVIFHFLGADSVGFFRIGTRFVGAVAEVVSEVGRILSWSHFASINSEAADAEREPRLGLSVGHHYGWLLVASTAVFLGLAAVATEIVPVVLGPGWEPVIVVVVLVAIGRIFLVPTVVSEAMFSVLGASKILPPLYLAGSIVMIASIALLAPFGVAGASIGVMLAEIIQGGMVIYAMKRWGQFQMAVVTGYLVRAIASTAAMLAAVLAIGLAVSGLNLNVPLVLLLGLKVAAGGASYIGVLFLTTPGLLRMLRADATRRGG